jgi:hypothetical protein
MMMIVTLLFEYLNIIAALRVKVLDDCELNDIPYLYFDI